MTGITFKQSEHYRTSDDAGINYIRARQERKKILRNPKKVLGNQKAALRRGIPRILRSVSILWKVRHCVLLWSISRGGFLEQEELLDVT